MVEERSHWKQAPRVNATWQMAYNRRMGRREQVAEQLRALMQRHALTPGDIERLTDGGGRPPISHVTVRRILKREARTEPAPATLRRIAEAAGESYTVAFPEAPPELPSDGIAPTPTGQSFLGAGSVSSLSSPGSSAPQTIAPTLTIDVAQRGTRYHLRFLGGDPPEGLAEELRRVLERWEQKAQ